MKCVCITNKILHDSFFNDSLKNLVEGEIYTAIKMDSSTVLLKEVKSSHPSGEYTSKRFREIDYEFGERICNEIIEKLTKEECL